MKSTADLVAEIAARSEEGVAQGSCGGGLPRAFQDDASLVHARIALERNLDVPPARTHRRCEGEREGDRYPFFQNCLRSH